MPEYKSIDIFTIEPVEIIRKKNKTKNTLGATLTVLIPFVIAFFFIYLFLTNQMKPDIVSDNIYYTKDLKSPVDFRIEFNLDFVKNDSIAWFEMITDDIKQTECYKNKSSTKHNRDEVKLCDYSTDEIGENNGVGFVFKMDVEDSYKTFLNLNDVEVPFYMSPNENVVYVIKRFNKKLCQFFLNETRTVCYPYNILATQIYDVYKDDVTNDIHLSITDLTQTYYFLNDILKEHYIHNDTSLRRIVNMPNNIIYKIYRSKNTSWYCDIIQDNKLIYKSILPSVYNSTELEKQDVMQYYSVNGKYIVYENYIDNIYNVYITNFFNNVTFYRQIVSNDNIDYSFFEYKNDYALLPSIHKNTNSLNIERYNMITNEMDLSKNVSFFKENAKMIDWFELYEQQEANTVQILIKYDDMTTLLFMIDENLNIDIINNPLNNIYMDESIFNVDKIDDKKYRFFSFIKNYPNSFNNWKNTVDLSYVFECIVTDDNYFNCTTDYISYLESNIQKNYTEYKDIKVATITYTNNTQSYIYVKDVIPQWNKVTKTMYSNVLSFNYNNELLYISNSVNRKLLYSTYLNSTELDTGYGIKINKDIWIFDNYKSGLNNKFKCYCFDIEDRKIVPDKIHLLQNAITCQSKDIYSIPFLLPDRIQLFDSKFNFEYKSNLTSGIILFNLNPTYKVTTYTSTKSSIINIIASVVGIISPLISAFTFVKKFWYKTENKEEINRRDSMNLNESLINTCDLNNNENSDLDLNIELSKVRNISSE